MNIIIKNCNNIENGTLIVENNKLNIKYAINGTGKSTISKAITYFLLDKKNNSHELDKLRSYKHLNKKEFGPEITGIDKLSEVKTFDEEYLNKYVFLPDELVKGSFDIFIRDSDYVKGMNEIEDLMSVIQMTFIENKDIDELISDFNELSYSFGKPVKTGVIHGASNLSKAFKDGNKVTNVPEEIQGYKYFIQSKENLTWIKWIIDGMIYLNLSDDCPYCVTDIRNKKNKILKIKEIYEPKTIEYLNKIVAVFSRLDKYFSEDTKQNINKFVSNIDGYTEDQARYLLEIKAQIDTLNEKFNNSKAISFRSFKEVDKVIEYLRNQKIDLELFSHLRSEATKQKSDVINRSIDDLLEKAGVLQGKINTQKIHIQKIIKENNEEINGFLKNAGFNYYVNIIEDSKNQYCLKLIHEDIQDDVVTNVKDHLSFGEKNAFAVILFMYDAIKSNADLIILDDPISSFDKNKKYAIIDMLFRKGGKSLRNKTVLLLTHDFEPIIDMVYHHQDRFEKPHTCFVENHHGKIQEVEIKKENIKTFLEICDINLKSDINDITKLVYLRRYYEVLNEKGNPYELISNILHRRITPIIKKEQQEFPMSVEDISDAVIVIKEKIESFDYKKIINDIINDDYIIKLYIQTKSNYEKLHLFRVLFGDFIKSNESSIIMKFINEAFHIENDYIYQLNPCEYQLVPQYVIDECDKHIGK